MSALRNVPNILSWSRMLSVIPLHALAVLGQPRWLVAGLLAAGITDILDGMLARRLACVSSFGSKLDSAADNVLGLAMVVWLFILCPAGMVENLPMVIYVLAASAFPLVLAGLRHGRIIALHTYSARFAALCAYGLAFQVLAGDLTGNRAVILLLAFAVTLKCLDECLILLLTDGVTADQQPSIFTWWNHRRRATSLPGGNSDDRRVAGLIADPEHDRIISSGQ